jgi:hypothetical protein
MAMYLKTTSPTTTPWIVSGTNHYDLLIQRLLVAKDKRERKRIYSQLTGGFDPEELRGALRRVERSATQRLFGKLWLGHSWRSQELISRLVVELDDWQDREIWNVSTPFDNGVLFSCGARSLVVGFSGRSDVLMISSQKILQAISNDYDLLLLRDPLDEFYQKGIPGFGSNPLETSAAISAWADQAGYAGIRAMGTSAGYCMAFLATLWQEWEHAMLVGGPILSEVPVFEHALSEIKNFDVSMHHCFSKENPRNSEGAAVIKSRVPKSEMYPYPGITAHNLLESIDAKSDVVAYIWEHLVVPSGKQA